MTEDPVRETTVESRVPAERRPFATYLARRVVAAVAPDELTLFEVRSRRFFGWQWRARDPLAWDVLGVSGEVLTPAALSASATVLGVMSSDLLERGTRWAVGRLRFGRSRRPALTRTPTVKELASYRSAALAAARRHVGEDEAALIADSVVAEIVAAAAERGDDEKR
jgi:hypothetical protein